MKEYQLMEIPFRSYVSEFKECKQLERSSQFDISYVRSINTRKKHLLLRRNNCQQSERNSILTELSIYAQTNAHPYINKFVGYALESCSSHQSASKVSNLSLLFQFAEISLDSYVQTPSDRSRKDSINLLQLIRDRLIEISRYFSECGFQLGWISFDFKYISLQLQAESINMIKFCYFPFSLIHPRKNQANNFTSRIYTLRELKELDNLEKQDQIESLFEDRNNLVNKSLTEGQMLQKIGLLLVKLVLLCCQQVHLRETEISLYALNKDFKIDYNWELINPLLIECSKQKDYKQLASSIQLMLFNTNDKSVLECQKIIAERSPQKPSERKHIHSHSHKKSSRKELKEHQSMPNLNERYIPLSRQSIIQKKEDLQERVRRLENPVEIKHQNGRYFGQIVSCKRQGIGIYYFEEGQIYGGEWKDDQMTGHGIYLFLAQNEYYEGNVECGIRSGLGCYHYKDGNIYNGAWFRDCKEGYGELYNAEQNEIYKGSFKNNRQHGLGIIEYANGSKFEGNFQNGLKDGTGRIYNAKDQVTFKANWIGNQVAGKVQIFYENGDYYQGFLKDGLMNGDGLYKYKYGTIYIGEFALGQMQGKCKIIYSNGDKYEGQISKGRFSSNGMYHYEKQKITEISQWLEGQQIGNVQFIHQDRSATVRMHQRKIETILTECRP